MGVSRLSQSMRFTWSLAREAFSGESAEPGFMGLAVDASAAGIRFVGFDEPAHRSSTSLVAIVSVGVAAAAVPFVASFGSLNASPAQVAMATPAHQAAAAHGAQITVWRGNGPETMQIYPQGGKLRGFFPGTGESGDISQLLPHGARIKGAPGTPFAGEGVFLHNRGGGGHFEKAFAQAEARSISNTRVSVNAKAEVIENVRVRVRAARSAAERLNIISAAAIGTGLSFGDVYYASSGSIPVAANLPPPPPPAPAYPAPAPRPYYHPRPHYVHHYHRPVIRVAQAAPCCCCCCCCCGTPAPAAAPPAATPPVATPPGPTAPTTPTVPNK